MIGMAPRRTDALLLPVHMGNTPEHQQVSGFAPGNSAVATVET